MNVTNELQCLRERIDKEGAKAAVHKLISQRQALKVRCFLVILFILEASSFFGDGY